MNTPTGRTPDPDAARRETDELRARLDADEPAALDRLADAARAAPGETPLRLDPDRRERLLATLRTTPVASAPESATTNTADAAPRILRFTRAFRVISREYGLAQVAAMLVVMALLAALSLTPFPAVQSASSERAKYASEPESFAVGGVARNKNAQSLADQLAAAPAPAPVAESSFEGNAARADAGPGPSRAKSFEHKLKSRTNAQRRATTFDAHTLPDPIPEAEESPASTTDGELATAARERQARDAAKDDGMNRFAGAAAAAAKEQSFDTGLALGGLSKGSGGSGVGEGSGIAVGKAVRQTTGRIVAKNEAANIALPGAPAPAVAIAGKKAELAKESANALADGDTRADAKDAPPPARPAANREVAASENAFSTFSLNVSDAAFRIAVAANARGLTPSASAMRAEEFVNSQVYADPQPRAGEAFSFRTETAGHPFAPNRQLLRVSVRAAAEGRAAGAPLNLVVALDRSGSMERADRRDTVAAALHTLADKIGPRDTVSVLGFARSQHLMVDRARGADAAAALRRIAADAGTPEGGTNLEGALAAAYAQLPTHAPAGSTNRVLLLTDGAANLGEGEPEKLAALVEAQRRTGNALDCFGIGLDGYDDAMLERLARHGDGRYAFLNDAESVKDGFAEKIAGALRPAARDVKVQVEFNPDRVASWRLIGYDKHRLTKEQFRDNTVDAAELAAAETGTAVYVIEPKADGRGDLGVARVRYLDPAAGEYREESRTLAHRDAPTFDTAPRGVRLAAVAALTGELYGDAPEAPGYDPDRLAKAARRLAGETPNDPRVQNLRELAEAAARNRK